MPVPVRMPVFVRMPVLVLVFFCAGMAVDANFSDLTASAIFTHR
jgi:hypothetical protein